MLGIILSDANSGVTRNCNCSVNEIKIKCPLFSNREREEKSICEKYVAL